ncbi:unnamed protein product [Pedinophyceae sp. YPF-701]|nr:unnamed protein product [Pedinophyceae sp. YPF-701]
MAARTTKMMQYINYRMRITIASGRQYLGRLMAYDKHMNLVLGDCEEFRKLPPRKGGEEREERRVLGMVLLRGDEVVSLTVEGPPPTEDAVRKAQVAGAGTGMGKAAGRGMPVVAPGQAAPGLAGPVRGMGGPHGPTMVPRPQMSAPPVPYGGPPAPGMGPPGARPPPGFPPAPGGMPPPRP